MPKKISTEIEEISIHSSNEIEGILFNLINFEKFLREKKHSLPKFRGVVHNSWFF